ncbi:MAG: SRPBCC domain-containing protein [Thermaerobacter sp.]|nr:SRPBCC domain-containing protein [Thermaerobacter sp.]
MAGSRDEAQFQCTLDAPRELVFEIWTDPRHVAQWWAPHGFTIPVCEIDLRPGGALRIDMRAPDGAVYPMTGTYDEIRAPERLAYTTSAMSENGAFLFEMRTLVTFAEQDGRTTVTVTMTVLRKTSAADPYLDGMEIGWTQQLQRLERYVGSLR